MFLVTGATGFIGSHLVESLMARGETVRVLVRRSSSLRNLPPSDTAYGDLATGEGLPEALAGADVVIHVAGVTKVLRAEEYYRGNVAATEHLARSLVGRPVRLVHVSSLAAVGPAEGAAPLTEDAEPRPITTYGKSKLEAERVLRTLLPDAVIVRPPVVYGPRDTGVFEVLKPLSRGWSLEIAGGPRWFSAIYVKDLVEGLIRAAHTASAAGRVYFLSHPKPLTWEDLTAAASRIMAIRPKIVRIPVPVAKAVGLAAELCGRAVGKPSIISREKVAEAQCAAWTCDARRASMELGFQAHTSLEQGLADTLAWYKEAGWLTY